MPWNPSPEVAVAREAARQLKAKAVVIIYVSDNGLQLGMASFSKDKKTCSAAANLGDALYADAIAEIGNARGNGDHRL